MGPDPCIQTHCWFDSVLVAYTLFTASLIASTPCPLTTMFQPIIYTLCNSHRHQQLNNWRLCAKQQRSSSDGWLSCLKAKNTPTIFYILSGCHGPPSEGICFWTHKERSNVLSADAHHKQQIRFAWCVFLPMYILPPSCTFSVMLLLRFPVAGMLTI